MSEFPPSVDELIENFDDLPEFGERVDFLIDLGRELAPPSAELQAAENIVDGCMSSVWLKLKTPDSNDAPIEIQADSDSQIIKGLIVVLMAFYQGQTAEEIVASDISGFFKRLGLDQHLSSQRRNGLFAMNKRINALALRYAESHPRDVSKPA